MKAGKQCFSLEALSRSAGDHNAKGVSCTFLARSALSRAQQELPPLPIFFWDAWDLLGSCEAKKVLCFVVVVVFFLFRTLPDVLCFSAASEMRRNSPLVLG